MVSAPEWARVGCCVFGLLLSLRACVLLLLLLPLLLLVLSLVPPLLPLSLFLSLFCSASLLLTPPLCLVLVVGAALSVCRSLALLPG
jgi:hypothetical protein